MTISFLATIYSVITLVLYLNDARIDVANIKYHLSTRDKQDSTKIFKRNWLLQKISSKNNDNNDDKMNK